MVCSNISFCSKNLVCEKGNIRSECYDVNNKPLLNLKHVICLASFVPGHIGSGHGLVPQQVIIPESNLTQWYRFYAVHVYKSMRWMSKVYINLNCHWSLTMLIFNFTHAFTGNLLQKSVEMACGNASFLWCYVASWWRHHVETLSISLGLCDGKYTNCWTNNPVAGELRWYDTRVTSLQWSILTCDLPCLQYMNMNTISYLYIMSIETKFKQLCHVETPMMEWWNGSHGEAVQGTAALFS